MKPLNFAFACIVAGLGIVSVRAESRVSFGVEINRGPSYAHPHYAPAPGYYPAPARSHAPVRGHWEDVTVKNWVPERWIMSRDRWGRTIRVLEPRYFTCRTERVWVENNRAGVYGYAKGRHR
ncbi:MAG: hypothetical protein RIQ93_128 [Verrucomicrobiota bacterium]|jgi:hypothetical protein